jgi:regulator of replication initiation timing
MATDRQELTEQAEALQGQLNSKQQQLDGAKERLVGKGAEVDTVSLELSELQLAVQADIKARKAQTTTNQSIQQYIKQQRKAWWQLRADKAEAAVARVSAATGVIHMAVGEVPCCVHSSVAA